MSKNIMQGVLGDCWLLSTCAALAKKESLLHRVLDPGQVLHGPGYTGMIGGERSRDLNTGL